MNLLPTWMFAAAFAVNLGVLALWLWTRHRGAETQDRPLAAVERFAPAPPAAAPPAPAARRFSAEARLQQDLERWRVRARIEEKERQP